MTIMEKLDLAKTDKAYYSAATQPQEVTFGELPYLAVAGAGDPNGPAFAAAAEALYTVAYTVKAAAKRRGRDFTVPKLEGLWWVEGGGDGLKVARELWQYKLLIRMPDFVSREMAEDARTAAVAKKPNLAPVGAVAYETLHEGRCVQIMHVGPYATEPETLAKLEHFIAEAGLVYNGNHHEIYLSDPKRSKPEAMKTILRYPVAVRD